MKLTQARMQRLIIANHGKDLYQLVAETYALGIAEGKAVGAAEMREKPAYAGVTVWRGDKKMTMVASEIQIEMCLENPLRSFAEECLREII